MPIIAPGTVDALQYEITLGQVRELSENATLRPAPRVLRCIPWTAFVCHPVDAFKQRLDRKLQIRVLLDSLSALKQKL